MDHSLLRSTTIFSPLSLGFFSLLFLLIGSFTLSNMMSPYIVGDLGGSNDITTYTITFFGVGNALGIPLGEALAGRIGVPKFFGCCLLLFACFSLACGHAPNYPLFIIFRFCQGLVSGPFYALLPLISALIPKNEKSIFRTIVVTLFAVVPVIGACWGGFIAYDYKWRWAFFLDTPLILFLAYFLWKHLRKHEFSCPKPPFDGVGYFFYCIGILSLSIVITMGQELDWFRSPLVAGLAIIGVPSLLFFILWDLHHPYPILKLRLLKKPIFSFALLNLALLFSAYFGMIILLALWLTLDVNYTPIWIGFLIGAMAIAGLFPTFLLRERFGFSLIDCRIPLGLAIIFFAISCFHTTTFDVEINFGRIALSRFIAGFGLAFFLPPLFRLCLYSFPEKEGLSVLSVFQAVRALSSGLGVAIYTTLWQRRQVFFHDRMGGDLTAFSNATQEFFTNAKQFQLYKDAAAVQLNDFLNRRSTSLALDDVFYLMAWIMVGLFVLLATTLFFRTKAFTPEKQAALENQTMTTLPQNE